MDQVALMKCCGLQPDRNAARLNEIVSIRILYMCRTYYMVHTVHTSQCATCGTMYFWLFLYCLSRAEIQVFSKCLFVYVCRSFRICNVCVCLCVHVSELEKCCREFTTKTNVRYICVQYRKTNETYNGTRHTSFATYLPILHRNLYS